MNHKRLLLLTKQYPYGAEEAFIENEIRIAASRFEKIVIIACEVPEKENKVRQLPSNVVVYSIRKKTEFVQKATDLCLACLRVNNKDSYLVERKSVRGIKRFFFLKYFDEKCHRIIKEIIEKNYLRDLVVDDYVLYSYWMFVTAKVGIEISSIIKPVKMVTRAHRYDLYENRNSLNYLPYRRLILEYYDCVFPCSEDGSLYLKQKFPQHLNKIKTAYLGTFDNGYTIENSNDIFTIVSCSRVEPVKRVERIFEAVDKVAQKGRKIRWVHIGSGSLHEQLLEKVKNKAGNLECFLMGSMQNKDVIEFYKNNQLDLFINVSSSEGLPVSIMEAISFGIPIVATDVGGTSEIVTSKTGILLEEDFEAESLISAIEHYIDIYKTDEYLNRRKECRIFWEENFQAERNYEKLYDEFAKD